MQKQEAATNNRRLFLKELSCLPLLFTGSGNLFSSEESRIQSPSGKRETLAVPGPMIPPVPAILLSINGLEGEPDELSVLWTFVVNGKPAQVGVSAEKTHRAADLLAIHKEFVLNVPVASMVKAFDRVDMNSGKVADKFKLSGLTRGEAVMVEAPTIEESPIHLECRVTHELAVPPSRRIFIADVICTRVLPGVCDSTGRLQVMQVPFFGMTSGSGEFFTMGEKVGQIGQSIGRTDIRY